jgi:hypothetical protein
MQEKRRAAYRKATASDNPKVILEIAQAFEGVGAIDAAANLRAHAEAVAAAHSAGKSAKPMSSGTIGQFADKLSKALIHFGPASPQARTAAGNLIQARGKTPSDDLITEVIKIAAASLNINPQPAAPDARPGAAAEAAEQAPAPPTTGAVEQTVMGPPAKAVEPPAVQGGLPVAEPTQDIEEAMAADEAEKAQAAVENVVAVAEVRAGGVDAVVATMSDAELAASRESGPEAEVTAAAIAEAMSPPAPTAGEEEMR